MNLGQRWRSATERNEQEVQRRADRQFDDERFDALRGPTARRMVAGAYVVVSLAMVASWFAGTIAGVVGLAVWGVSFVALRLSVRSLADMPDHVLDERMRRERHHLHLGIPSGVGGAGHCGRCALHHGDRRRRQRQGHRLHGGPTAADAVFWGVFALVLGAPSLAMAWRRSAVL